MNRASDEAGRRIDRDFVWPPRAVDEPDSGEQGVSVGSVAPPRERAPESPRCARGIGGFRSVERRVFGALEPALPDRWCAEPVDDACPRCAGSIGDGEVDGGGCASCRGARLGWHRAVRLGAYKGDLRDAIMACKYHRDRRSGVRLGDLLGVRVREALGATGTVNTSPIVVPVPATLRRRLANGGIDHACVLARGVARELGVGVQPLLRRRSSGRQARAAGAAVRARNVRRAFVPRSGIPPPKTGVVVLVDDVRTTGATAAACFRCLAGVFARPGVPAVERPLFVLATAGVSERRRGRIAAHGAEEGVQSASERKT